MKRALPLILLLLSAFVLAAEKASVGSLLKDAAKFDNKAVVVTGKVDKFKARTSRSGNKYFTFELVDGKEHVAVYGKGELKPEPKDGDKVEVTGMYAKERKVGSSTFKNEIDVTQPKKSKDKFGVHIAK